MLHRVALARVLTCVAAAAISATLAATPAASDIMQWQFTYNQETRYSSWHGNRGYPAAGILPTAGGSGSQFYTPVAVSLTGVRPDMFKFELVGRGGYVESKQSTPSATGSVSTFTDTVAAATWTYLGIPGVQPFVSLSVNIPTGTSALFGTDTFARMDPDLVDIATFGEGWNYGATAGVTVAITNNAAFSAGVGHTSRGGYDRETVAGLPGGTSVVRLEPGDITTINAAFGFRNGPFTGRLSGSYSFEGTTSFGGVPSFQLGDRFFVSGSGSYAWTESSISSVVASWSFAQENKGIIPPFATEAINSNSSVYRIRFDHAFVFGNWSFGPMASWLFRDENSYVPTAFQFVPAKTRWGAGASARYRVNDMTLLYVSAEHIWIDEGARIFPGVNALPTPARSYTGWQVIGGASVRY